MQSYFYESNIDDITSPKLFLDGGTPNVDPKIGSNSEVRYQSEISNIESQRSIKQEPIANKGKLIKNNSQLFSIKFDSQGLAVSKKQIHHSHFKIENSENNKVEEIQQIGDGQLKKVLEKQKLIKFKDNLLHNAHILTKTMFNEKKSLFNYLFQGFTLLETKQTKQKSTLTFLEKFMVCQVLLPQEKFSKFWNLFSILFSFLILWLSPFINSFQLSQTYEIQRIIEIIFIYQIIDGIISCNKAILKQGELVVERKIIIDNYLRYQLPSDFLNFIFWIIIYIGMNQYKISEVLSLFQIIIIIQTVYSKINSFVDCLYLSGHLNEILDLVFLIISLYYFIHIIACLWHYLAIISTDLHEVSWLMKYQLSELSFWIKYDYAVYWATMTMVTVGYGDITASNAVEIVFSNFTMFISSFVFAYSMNSIGMIIKNFYDTKNLYKRKLILINTYMKNNLVDQSIQNRVRNFLKNQVDQEGKNNQSEVNDIIENLPTGLKNDVNTNIRTRILQDIQVLVNNFSKSTQQSATQLFEKIYYIPNDTIYNPEDRHKDQYLYYIDQGIVKQIEIRTQKKIQQYTEGHTFGEYQFITGQDTRFKIISSDFTSVYRISRIDFLKVLQNNQKDKERLYQMKDQLLYQQDFGIIGKKCCMCQKIDHLSSDCFLISYKPNLEKLVKSEEFIQQYRNFYKRKEGLKLNALNSIQGVQDTVIQYQQQQDECTGQKESFTEVSGTKKQKEQTSRRQSDFKGAVSHSSISDQSPDIKQQENLLIGNNKQMKQESRRQSKSFTGKFIHEKSIKYIQEIKDNQNQRKISIALLKEPTYIATEHNSKEMIQYKSGKNIQLSSVTVEMDEPTKINTKTINLCLDKVYQFQNYFPQSNIDNVIINYHKQKGKYTSQYIINLNKSQKYTFYYKIAKIATGMKQIKNSLSKRTIKVIPYLKKNKESIQK